MQKPFFSWLAVVLLLAPLQVFGQEQTREFAPPIIREPGKWAISSYYVDSSIKRGSREGNWNAWANTIAYSLNDLLTPYVSANAVDFFHDFDSAGDLGTYFKFEDAAYLRAEIGFGGDVDYIYNFQTRLEYEHRLAGKLFWQVGTRYLDLTKNDVYTVYPGLIYYLGGRNYFTAFYHVVHTEGWSNARWSAFRGNFALTRRLSAWLGLATGERIYNIELLPASEQRGYIYLSGLDLKVAEGIDIKLGYSYARQKPDVTRRGVEVGVQILM